MAGSDGTKLGDYCKWLESDGTNKVFGRNTGIMARMDGRAFHSFTRGLDKPYDEHLLAMMSYVAASLVEEFSPTLAYWQSDEITLYWSLDPTTTREYPFGGKAHKLTSVLAAQSTAFFLKTCLELMPKKFDELPHFDARVFAVPSARDAYQLFLWRHRDAVRNAHLAFSQAHFGHKKTLNKSVRELHQMFYEAGLDFKAAPNIWRQGEFLRRATVVVPNPISAEALIKMRARAPDVEVPALVERSRVISVNKETAKETLEEVARILAAELVPLQPYTDE